MLEFSMRKRVYYGDTDAIGIVYHANYLRFFEMARTESLRSKGIELPFLLKEMGIQFAVVDIKIKFHKPARLDDDLMLVSKVIKIGQASVTYQQSIHMPDQKGDLLCEAEVKLVTVDKQMRPVAVPDALKQEIS